MMEQKKFYSFAYSEQNIQETHKSILNKNTMATSPDKKGEGGDYCSFKKVQSKLFSFFYFIVYK